MIRNFPGHDTVNPPGSVGCSYCENNKCNWACETAMLSAPPDYRAQNALLGAQQGLTKAAPMCYTIKTGMSLEQFKKDMANAYYNRDAEAMYRLLESLQNVD